MNNAFAGLLLVTLLSAGLFPAGAQPRRSRTPSADSLVARKSFVFRADWVIALNGRRRLLTPPYELVVTSDSVVCHLPFEGRLYTVPGPDELRLMSIRFISRKFRFMVRQSGSSGWDITIAPLDVHGLQELRFAVSSRGWATLTIRSTGRDPVSYEGSIVGGT